MKTWKRVTADDMFTIENARMALLRASERKRNRAQVRAYLENEQLLYDLLEELKNGTYRPTPVKPRRIYDQKSGKWRNIECPIFKDQIVQWMFMLLVIPYMSREFIQHTVASIPGRGPKYAHDVIRHWAKCKKRETRWVVQADVRKFYASIDKGILMEKLRRKIRDRRVLEIVGMFLSLFVEGLSLGHVMCQWFSNFFLSDLDHYIKEKLGVKYYVRYVDDLLFLVGKKSIAVKLVQNVSHYLDRIGLKLKTVGQGAIRIYRWAGTFVDFVGKRTYRNGFQELRKRTYLSIRRQCYRIIKKGRASLTQARSISSRWGFAKNTDSSRFKAFVLRTIYQCKVKEILKYEGNIVG